MDGINSSYQPKKRLLPPSIRTDERSQALLYLIWGLTQFQLTRLNVYNVDTVDESVLPHLIQQFRLEKFMPVDLPVARRRQLIKKAIEIWRYLGTVYGMKAVISAVLAIEVDIKEWFDYNGTPHTFTVAFLIDASQNTYLGNFGTTFQQTLRNLIEASKPARSHLLRLDLAMNVEADLNMAVPTANNAIVMNFLAYYSVDETITIALAIPCYDFALIMR